MNFNTILEKLTDQNIKDLNIDIKLNKLKSDIKLKTEDLDKLQTEYKKLTGKKYTW